MLLRRILPGGLFFILLLLPAELAAQDTSADAADVHQVETSFLFYPAPIWSRTTGFSAGAGYEIENFPIPNSSLQATVKPGQHMGRYALTYALGSPYDDLIYLVPDLYYETTGRHWYYGMHTTSSRDDEVAVEKEMVKAELRLGIQPFGGMLRLQPSAAYVRHHVHGYETFSPGAVQRLSPLSQLYLFYAAGETSDAPRYQEGLTVGLSGALDFRDRPARPRRGLLLEASAHRSEFRATPNIAFDRFEAYAYGYIPVRDNTFAVRVVAMNVNHKSKAPIPFYMHPTLDDRLLPGYSRNRFYGNDLLALTAEYGVTLFQMVGFAAMDALLSAGVGNVYLDMFREFEPAISFDEDPGAGPRYPLRPSVAAGFNLQGYDTDGWSMRVLLGWGVEGVRLVRFAFVHDMRRAEIQTR